MGLGRDPWERRKSGEEFPIRISLSPLETAHGTLITSIIRDVTALRRAESRFRGLLEAAPDGIVVVDVNGAIVIVNTQTERMFGYTREELIGTTIETLVPDRFRERHVNDRNAYLRDPKTRPMGAGRALTGLKRDGTEFPVEISLSRCARTTKRFRLQEARRLAQRLEIHYTPKHGSWLNMAENELSCLTRQCLSRRIGTIEQMREEVAAWDQSRNRDAVKINWRFSIEQARVKLRRVYPQLQD